MNRIPVVSSELASVGYDAATNTLEVEFKTGSVYDYSNVPEDIYTGLMSAPSHGKYFNEFIKQGGYSFRRVM